MNYYEEGEMEEREQGSEWVAVVERVLDGLGTPDVEAWVRSTNQIGAIEDEDELPKGWQALVEVTLSGMSRVAVEQFAGRSTHLMDLEPDLERANLYLGAAGAAYRALGWIDLEEAIRAGEGRER